MPPKTIKAYVQIAAAVATPAKRRRYAWERASESALVGRLEVCGTGALPGCGLRRANIAAPGLLRNAKADKELHLFNRHGIVAVWLLNTTSSFWVPALPAPPRRFPPQVRARALP